MTDEQFDQLMGALGRIEALLAVQAATPQRPGRGHLVAMDTVATVVAGSTQAEEALAQMRRPPR